MHLKIRLIGITLALVTGIFWYIEHRSNSFYVEWHDNGVIAGLHIVSLSGGEFSIQEIIVDGVFRPTLAFPRTGQTQIREQLTYPIQISPPCSMLIIMRGLDLGDEEINRQYYMKRPKSVAVRSDRGDFEFSLTKNYAAE